jgi:hypothetical protein
MKTDEYYLRVVADTHSGLVLATATLDTAKKRHNIAVENNRRAIEELQTFRNLSLYVSTG